MSNYSITDLERLTGIKAHTLRMWEKRYKICRPCRDGNNVRQYDDSDLQHLIKVSHLNKQGHRISAIACMSDVQLDALYKNTVEFGDSGCCFMDKLTIAVEKTQETRLLYMLDERISTLGVVDFVNHIWGPMQERLAVLVLSDSLQHIHLKFFDQTVRKILDSKNMDLIMEKELCLGSVLLINTCDSSNSIYYQLVKHILIKNGMDTVSLDLCREDWVSLKKIIENRNFNEIYIHYQSSEKEKIPPCKTIDQWIDSDTEVFIYGTGLDRVNIPDNWEFGEIEDVLNYINTNINYKNQRDRVISA